MASDRVYLGIVNDMVFELASVSVECWLVRCESSDSFEIASVLQQVSGKLYLLG